MKNTILVQNLGFLLILINLSLSLQSITEALNDYETNDALKYDNCIINNKKSITSKFYLCIIINNINKNAKSAFIFSLLCLLISVTACNKENGSLEVKMTDAAGPYDKVNIDIQGISVKFDKDTSSWVELTTNKGVYDLLQFQNGVTTTIATSNNLPTNIVKEVRFVLGTNNTVVVSGVSYPLTMSSQDESGLKVKVSKKLEKTLSTLTIDFDAAESVKESNGTYKLQPVLKLK